MKELNQTTFAATIKKSSCAVVKFFAPWCVPCKSLDSTLGKWKPKKTVDRFAVNVEENSSLVNGLGVQSVPTIIVFEKGVEKSRAFGVPTIAELDALIK